MKPIVNAIVEGTIKPIRYLRRRFIIEIPAMPPEMQAKIKADISAFASKTISDSVAKTVNQRMDKR
jgi:hypothetical protein